LKIGHLLDRVVNVAQFHRAHVGIRKIRRHELAIRQGRASKIGADELAGRQIRMAQPQGKHLGIGQIRAHENRALLIRPGQQGLTQVNTGKLDTAQVLIA